MPFRQEKPWMLSWNMVTRCCSHSPTWPFATSGQENGWTYKPGKPAAWKITPFEVEWTPLGDRNHPSCPEVAGNHSVDSTHSSDKGPKPQTLERQSRATPALTTHMNIYLTWSFFSEKTSVYNQGHSGHSVEPWHKGTLLPIVKRPRYLHC